MIIGGLVFYLGILAIILFFVHINHKWGMVYIFLKYSVIFLLAVFIINYLFWPDLDYLKAILAFSPGIFITFGLYELITSYQDNRKIGSAAFFITYGGIYQYFNYQTYILGKPSEQSMVIFGIISFSFWPMFAIGVLAMIILIWRNK